MPREGPDKDLPSGVETVPIVPTGHLPVLSTDEAVEFTPLPWHLMSVQDDGRKIAIGVDASMSVPKGARVEETADEVTVTVYGTTPRGGPRVAVGRYAFTTVELPHPLGSRRLRGS